MRAEDNFKCDIKMGNVKKIARPINQAKNKFIDWLNIKNAECIDVYEGYKSDEWDYYRSVSAFIGERLYNVYFMIWKGYLTIDYCDEENRYNNMNIEEFLQLLE